MKKSISIIFAALFCCLSLHSQKDFYKGYTFTKADTLRGMLRPERTCYDVTFYDLNIQINPNRQHIKGYVDVFFDVVQDFKTLQIDLFNNMQITQITSYDQELEFNRVFNAVFVDLPNTQMTGTSNSIRVFYEGKPIAAKNAPWDGGFVWKKDDDGKHFIGVACEGTGASLWWPNKDHLSDEPDSMAINITIPDGLMCVSNGNLREKIELENDWTEWKWFVTYPINNYNVTVNIADYAHFSRPYTAFDGEKLEVDFYVLKPNLEKAKKHFEQVNGVLEAYEKYFDKYPFWNDGLAFVETPYLGMEHQSAIAYGNKYMRGYLGGMIPNDMNWDFIIVHELGHEWFGNSVSSNDHAEMWIHESFTTYMEALYVEHTMSYEDAVRYLIKQKGFIKNKEPILGPMDVNFDRWKSSDHYFKGSWVLHTLRTALHNDELWFEILKGFYQKYKISHCTTQDFIDYFNEKTHRDWTPIFEQYLMYPSIPTLLYAVEQKGKDVCLKYKWEADVDEFAMPILAGKKGNHILIYPNTKVLQEATFKKTKKEDFELLLGRCYINSKKIKK